MNTDKKRRYTKVSNDKTDRKALIRSAVEWFAFVLVVMAAALILLNTAFEVCEIDLNGKKTDVFVSKVGYTVERGDAVALEKNCVYVIACEGEGLPLNSDGRPAIESVLYQNRLCGQDEISELLDDGNRVPNGFVLVNSFSAGGKSKAELLETERIIGEVKFVVHPYLYLGKTIYEAVGE